MRCLRRFFALLFAAALSIAPGPGADAANFYNKVKAATPTTGTGTITQGSAVSGYRVVPAAADGKRVKLLIEGGSAWEVSWSTYTHAGTTLTRALVESSTGSLLNLSGSATFAIIAAADDLSFRGARVVKAADQTAANYTTDTAIAWDAESFDTDGFHSTATNTSRLTVPADLGINYVEVIGAVRVNNNTPDTWSTLSIRRNGTTIATLGVETGLTSVRNVISSGPLDVAAGDYFELFLTVESDTSTDVIASVSFFTIKVLG